MRVVAILAVYNEERFIGGCLEHLFEQGVETYLIDNASTDKTVEIAERYRGRGLIDVENFPRVDGVYRWRAMLHRKQQLAVEIEADWLIHMDADEFRLPPPGMLRENPDLTLAGAFAEVEARGYNAVNFIEYTFVPTREEPDHDHPRFYETMKSYYPFMLSYPYQIKAWKKQPKGVPMRFAQGGGHKVVFPDLCLYPESFAMRHYPYLSVPHFAKKYLARKYDPAELERGWHGWRSRLTEEMVELPSREELNTYTTDDELDVSNPRTQHVAAKWTLPEKPAAHKAPKRHAAAPASASREAAGGERMAVNVGRVAKRQLSPAKNRIYMRASIIANKRRASRAISASSQSIVASRDRLLDAISGAKDLTFFRGQGNVGDQLIQAGARQLLAGIPYTEVIVPYQDIAKRLKKFSGHTALITGGGGWCGPFHLVMPNLLPVIERQFERVVVLPSTVDTAFPEVREAIEGTEALFFAREWESYRQLRELCNSDIAHDSAFFFDFEPYRVRGRGVLSAYRKDGEAVSDKVPPNNNDISLTCEALDQWLWTIARHEAVQTDRAHVMIAGAMLGKKVMYKSTNYHKVPAIAEYALKDFPVERIFEKEK